LIVLIGLVWKPILSMGSHPQRRGTLSIKTVP